LYKKLKIASLDDLRDAVKAHRIARRTGFGAKSEQTILKSVCDVTQTAKRIL
jgi:DNA polymerase/3'-5' exonuclease PolX